MDGCWTDSDGTGAYSDSDEAGAWRSADSDRRLDSDGRSDGGAMRGGRGLGRGAVRGEWLIPHPVAYARVAGGGSPAGRGGAYTSMYTSICLYSRRVACREGRRLYIHVYKYMFIQPVGRLQGGEAPAGRTAATPMRRAPAGGGDRAVRHDDGSDVIRI
jgi:hypothetical protein